MQLSFTSTYTYLKKINTLRTGPKWDYQKITVTGDKVDKDGKVLTEDQELWLRNPIECIAELISNLAFNGLILYVLECMYADGSGNSCIYDEMWTGDWWWDVQVCLKMLNNLCLLQFQEKNSTWRSCLPHHSFNR